MNVSRPSKEKKKNHGEGRVVEYAVREKVRRWLTRGLVVVERGRVRTMKNHGEDGVFLRKKRELDHQLKGHDKQQGVSLAVPYLYVYI